MNLEELKAAGEAPAWMDDAGFKTISTGYMLPGETPHMMYSRVAAGAARNITGYDGYARISLETNGPTIKRLDWAKKFFDLMWNNWLCPASPVLSNMGTDRGLPISCNSIHVGDSVDNIFHKNHELAMLSKNGAGVGIYMGDVRGRGAGIAGNGKSEGVIPWCKTYDTTTLSVNQGSTRRGASVVYLPIEHSDIKEFLQIRRPVGDVNRQCLNLNHGITITNQWMREMLDGDVEKRELWKAVLELRMSTGEPYLMFVDRANDQNPECYKANGLSVKTSNLCCLAGDTEVVTSNGFESIASLVGRTVTIWDGQCWVENNTFEERGVGPVTRITLANHSSVDSTENHRWFVARSYSDIRNKVYRETLTRDLKVGNFIQSHAVETHGDIEVSAAYLKGFLAGDGTQHNGVPMLNLHSPKYMCIDALIESGSELPAEPLPKYESRTITNIGFCRETNHTDCYDNVLGDQKSRFMQGISCRRRELLPWVVDYRQALPSNVISWTRESKLELISGLLDSDGTITKERSVQIASKHKQFIYDLQRLLRSIGVVAGVDVYAHSTEISICEMARLTINPWAAYILLQELSCQRIKWHGKPPNRQTTGWRKITKLEALPGEQPVYCPVVASTGKFALANGLMTGNSEIYLHTDPDHTFVCCLSSMNLVKWDEWKDTDAVQTATRFLDCVMEEYIRKTDGKVGFESAHRFAVKSRALGLGVLGWHSLLQQKNLPFDSFDSMMLNAEVFRTIRGKAEEATKTLAEELGEPEWCKGFGRRHTHLMAVAPTASNSVISGGHSAGIEPVPANAYTIKSAKGTFLVQNPTLKALFVTLDKDTPETWASINAQAGSVQHLDFLSDDQKLVFLTAREINQHAIIKQAIQRQRWIDQGQSVNLFFASNASAKYIHDVHIAAWEGGMKGLYYLRASGVIRGDLASRSKDECAACEG